MDYQSTNTIECKIQPSKADVSCNAKTDFTIPDSFPHLHFNLILKSMHNNQIMWILMNKGEINRLPYAL